MTIETKPAKFEVLTDKLGIPKGIYEGTVETLVTALHGHEKRGTNKANIFLTREHLIASGRDPNSNLIFSQVNVLPFIASGDVREI